MPPYWVTLLKHAIIILKSLILKLVQKSLTELGLMLQSQNQLNVFLCTGVRCTPLSLLCELLLRAGMCHK